MPDSYYESISLKDSDSNSCEEDIYKYKSCIETRVFVPLFPKD